MTPETEFGKRLMVLAEVFGESLSPVRIAGYWAALSDLDQADLWAAMDHALRASKFFPRPAELREHADGLAHARTQRRRLAAPIVPAYQRLEAGDTPVSSERVLAFLADLREKVKAMPGPAPRPHGTERT